jgi:soluble lytic murein transglycosylase
MTWTVISGTGPKLWKRQPEAAFALKSAYPVVTLPDNEKPRLEVGCRVEWRDIRRSQRPLQGDRNGGFGYPLRDKKGPALLFSIKMLHRLACFGAACGTAMCVVLTSAKAEPAPQANATKTAAVERPMLPSPHQPGKAESQHKALYDRAIAPLLATKVSDDDAGALRDAVNAYSSGKPEEGDRHRGRIADPVAVKLATWHRLRSGFGSAADYRGFLDKNPAWPERRLLTQRYEETLFTGGGSSPAIRSAFANGGPDHGAGFAALASSYLAEGNTGEARKYAAKTWRELSLAAKFEKPFLDRFGSMLTLADHKARLDRLIIDDVRWKDDRNSRAAVARRVIALMPEAERKRAEARLAVFMQQKGALGAIQAAPAIDGADWGFAFHKIQALRRADNIDAAAKLMLTVPIEPGAVNNNDEWWTERRTLAYASLRKGKPKLAYDIVSEAGPLTVNPLKDQSFMAGWLALRYLKDPAKAKQHFAVMQKAADGPLSRAKANYWVGRTAEALKDKAAATAAYTEAARDRDTFHGLLALQKLEPGQQNFKIVPPAEPSPDETTRFNDLDAAKAVIVAQQAKLDRSISRVFLVQLRFHLKSEAELAMIAHLAEAIGDTQSAVRTAKAGIADRKNLFYYGYPVHPFPAYAPLRKPPETAFLLGVARQETEFNTLTVSGAGAKGLLQVMTVTAKHVCQDYKIKCDIKRLLSDPAYNTMMGSAYIGDRMQDFTGSYVLTLAGYNAGPGRARQWIREFGDPRDTAIDPIDWIERIPIQETREYVAKVLANVQVYRARLGEEESAVRLEKDLERARIAGKPVAPPAGSSADEEEAASGG